MSPPLRWASEQGGRNVIRRPAALENSMSVKVDIFAKRAHGAIPRRYAQRNSAIVSMNKSKRVQMAQLILFCCLILFWLIRDGPWVPRLIGPSMLVSFLNLLLTYARMA